MRRFSGGKLVAATHNAGKLDEIAAFLVPLGVTLLSAAELGLEVPDETEDSFVGNARIKAHAAAQATGLPAIADDSGIEVDALGGAPGVRTADWAETPQGRDFGHAMTQTWQRLTAAGAVHPISARFRCTLVLAWPDGQDAVCEGVVEGRIAWPVRGMDGHGFDPMFQPLGHTRTFGEMTAAEKNAISHRAVAFRKLIAGCFT
jgi:XTP/dITP diphosphohydrolase